MTYFQDPVLVHTNYSGFESDALEDFLKENN